MALQAFGNTVALVCVAGSRACARSYGLLMKLSMRTKERVKEAERRTPPRRKARHVLRNTVTLAWVAALKRVMLFGVPVC